MKEKNENTDSKENDSKELIKGKGPRLCGFGHLKQNSPHLESNAT